MPVDEPAVAAASDVDDRDEHASELFSLPDAATWLGISRSSLYRGLQSGQVPVQPIVIGHTRYLVRRQLEAWLTGPTDDVVDEAVVADGAPGAAYDELDALFEPRGASR